MADSEQVKAALAALADGETTASTAEERVPLRAAASEPGPAGQEPDYRAVIRQAVDATDDIEAAAEFVDSVGLDRLEAAVERAEHEVSGLAGNGRAALATFERFRVAAAGPRED